MNDAFTGPLGQTLSQYGLELAGTVPTDVSGRTVTIRRGALRETYQTQFLHSMTLTSLKKAQRDRPNEAMLLVCGPFIGQKSADALREAKIQFIDFTGNAHIAFGDVLIDVRGRHANPYAEVEAEWMIDGAAEPSENLFSPRRAQVIFVLLVWRELASEPMRRIAEVAGVSVGQAQSTIRLLSRLGFWNDERPRGLQRREELLDLWVAAYPSSLRPSLQLKAFRGQDLSVAPSAGAHFALSGESALPDLIRPATLTLYVDEFDPQLAVVNRWRSDPRPSVFVRRKFWRDPEIPDADRNVHEPHRVPAILVYADLIASGEARQREVAEDLRTQNGGLLND